jgi:hypothetical protein
VLATLFLSSPDPIGKIYLRIRRRARQIASRFPSPVFYTDFPLAVEFSRRYFETDPVVRQVRNFAFNHMQDDFGHGPDHAIKVSLDAGALVIVELQDQDCTSGYIRRRMREAQCAGLLHDIKRKEKDHASAGSEYSRTILSRYPFSRAEIEDICQAIQNHEAFKEMAPIHTFGGLLISNCLYDADKFRWGPDNFRDTVWNMVRFMKVPLGSFMERYPRGMEKIADIKKTFRSDTGMKYGPQFIDTGLAIGRELYTAILEEFSESILS